MNTFEQTSENMARKLGATQPQKHTGLTDSEAMLWSGIKYMLIWGTLTASLFAYIYGIKAFTTFIGI